MLSLGGETGSSLFILPPQPNTLTTTRSTLPPSATRRPSLLALRRIDSPSLLLHHRSPSSAIIDSLFPVLLHLLTLCDSGGRLWIRNSSLVLVPIFPLSRPSCSRLLRLASPSHHPPPSAINHCIKIIAGGPSINQTSLNFLLW
ncbi:hypothetical protein BJX76DRAFT_248804 [Aspergillus varians]